MPAFGNGGSSLGCHIGKSSALLSLAAFAQRQRKRYIYTYQPSKPRTISILRSHRSFDMLNIVLVASSILLLYLLTRQRPCRVSDIILLYGYAIVLEVITEGGTPIFRQLAPAEVTHRLVEWRSTLAVICAPSESMGCLLSGTTGESHWPSA
jgi:hypothetical protein